MRLVFLGSGAFGLPTLQSLASHHEILAVVTQPDRVAGRGGKLTPTPIGAWAAEKLPTVPLLKPERINAPEIVAQIRGFNADGWVVIAYGQKLGAPLLSGVFAINLHASLLPRWRGAAPIQSAILSGDTQTGNSVITLADRMDAGLILAQSHRAIDPPMTAAELHDLLAADGPALVEQVLHKHLARTLEARTQDESEVTIASKLTKDDGVIDFDQKADFLRRQIHALTPWPGVAVVFGGFGPAGQAASTLAQVKLLRVESTDLKHEQDPGVLLDPGFGTISCGHHTVLRVTDLQPAGKRPMSWEDFVRGAGRVLMPGTAVMSAREAE